MAARAQSSAVGLGECLRLVGGQVDSGGAVSGAALAGQAQVERFGDLGGGEAAGQGAAEQLGQDVRPAASGVLLVAGGPVGGAHDVGGVAVSADAATDA